MANLDFGRGSSTCLIAMSVAMNFAFGSNVKKTYLEASSHGAAYAFADVLKVVAPIVIA